MRNQYGIITIMVTMLMVPIVVITGLMVDVSRLRMYSSQASMAADAYGAAVLSDYDYILKEIYGLYSVSQTKQFSDIADEYKSDAKLSFNPNLQGTLGADYTFMPYANADVDFTCVAQEGASLSDPDVLTTQISQFMKYRIAQILLENADLLDALENMDANDADMDAIEARENLTDVSDDVMQKIKDYYDCLKTINDYPSYIAAKRDRYNEYANILKDITTNSDYHTYYTYKQAQKKQQENSEAVARGEDPLYTLSAEEKTLLESSEEELEDLFEYIDNLQSDPTLENAFEAANNAGEGKLIDFDTADDKVSELNTKATTAENAVEQLESVIEDYRTKIEACESEAQKENMRKEIENFNLLIDQKQTFVEIYDAIETANHDTEKNADNQTLYNERIAVLNGYCDEIKAGTLDPASVERWTYTLSGFQWYAFRSDASYSAFYEELENGFDVESDDEKKNEYENKKSSLQKVIDDNSKMADEKTVSGTRSISDIEGLTEALRGASEQKGTKESFWDYMSGGFSLDALKQYGVAKTDQLMVAAYDFEMFSSRVTGVEPEEEDDGENSVGNSEPYKDYTLTQIEMNKDVNFLYGAEIEYLIGGKTSSESNLNEVRNTICGVQGGLNLLATFRIYEINEVIETVSTGLSVFAGPAAPAAKITIEGLMRSAVATLLTVDDWTNLKARHSIIMAKDSLADISDSLMETIESVIGEIGGGGSGNHSIRISYEQYLFILMMLLTSPADLMERTSDLITLNVNQAKAPKGTEITSDLSFKMTKTVTAVNATCKVKADFVVIPDTFAAMFMEQDAENQIDVIENQYFGYSVIRGY